MTNTLLKIATLKEQMDRKAELCTLLVNNWLQEDDKDAEPGKKLARDEALEAFKKMGKKLLKLEEKLKLSGIDK